MAAVVNPLVGLPPLTRLSALGRQKSHSLLHIQDCHRVGALRRAYWMNSRQRWITSCGTINKRYKQKNPKKRTSKLAKTYGFLWLSMWELQAKRIKGGRASYFRSKLDFPTDVHYQCLYIFLLADSTKWDRKCTKKLTTYGEPKTDIPPIQNTLLSWRSFRARGEDRD